MFFIFDRLLARLLCWIYNILGIETREKRFERIEKNLLNSCRRSYHETFIPVETNLCIRTVAFNPGSNNRPPLVLLHGLDSGLCCWHQNVKVLSEHCTVYAVDLPGFGRSSKPNISGTAQEIERKYVLWLEQWRQRLGIERFFLLGHDFGGYVATLYTLTYSWRVCQLILYDPWGFSILPFGITDRSPTKRSTRNPPDAFPKWISKLDYFFRFLQGRSFLRIFLWYYYLVKSLIRMVLHPFQFLTGLYEKQDPLDDYKRLCKQAQNSSGEIAYRKLSVLNVWAKDPLIKRINSRDNPVFITFIFGSKSWFDHRSAYEVKCSRSNQESVTVHIIECESDQVIHLVKPRKFESIILNKLESYEQVHDEGWIEDDWICFDSAEDEGATKLNDCDEQKE